jgi:hypothetical protein
MKAIGRGLCLLALVLLANASRAEVTASIDRDRVALGDTLRLTITATEDEEISSTDLRPLLADFEILQRSTSSSTNITNGRRTHTKQILLDITPRRQGTLKVPPLRVGQATTNMLLIAVGPAPDKTSGDETVIFEVEVDRDTVYVQGQIILTLRLQQAINLDNRGISELELDNAFVRQLEQQSFQRNIDGRPWLVHEIRYAIFPEQSGILEIPVQTFSARESKPRRSFFDLNSGGRQLRRSTEPLSIEVLPRPASFPAGTWLPARSISIEENWSTPPEQLRAGESATRTITIKGEGLQGAQLPPVLFPAAEGLKYYPDQPVIGDSEVSSGLLGSRQDSAALVSTREGNWTIPEIRIPWWDTEKRELRYAVLPQRVIAVAAADPAVILSPPPLTVPDAATQTIALTPARDGSGDILVWQLVAAMSIAAWLLTLYLLWRSRRGAGAEKSVLEENPSEQHAFKQLLAACASGSGVHARESIVCWAAALHPDRGIVSLRQVEALFDDASLSTELKSLDTSLYSGSQGTWDGAALAETVRRLRRVQRQSDRGKGVKLELYPA